MLSSASAKPVTGVYAAVLTPRGEIGELDTGAFGANLSFLLEKGIRGFAINGATGEYCLTRPQELAILLAKAREVAGDSARVLCGVGSAGLRDTLERCAIAEAAGVYGLLLPMPHFFPYSQDDLLAYCTAVAESVRLPVLLYNLPFTTLLEPATVHAVMARCTNVVGIKDSSGNLDILRTLGGPACRIVGSDGVLAQALREQACDGVVSGVAGVYPELVTRLYAAGADAASAEFAEASAAMDEFLTHLGPFPVPWGLKWVAEARGIHMARFDQPVSAQRTGEASQLRDWVLERIGSTPEGVGLRR